MKSLFMSVVIAAAALSFAPMTASADEAHDRTTAIALCRGEVARQAGVAESEVRLDSVRARGRNVRVDLDLWRNGELTNIRCSVEGAASTTQTIAEITPALSTATASN